jgi:hypothetical protein
MASGEQPRFRINSEQEISREYAAILLKVPDSGKEWLDEMIVKSLRNDLAAKAMQGCLSYSNINPQWGNYHENCNADQVAEAAIGYADSLLEQQGYKEKETK